MVWRKGKPCASHGGACRAYYTVEVPIACMHVRLSGLAHSRPVVPKDTTESSKERKAGLFIRNLSSL
jgi:hypothetical protein